MKSQAQSHSSAFRGVARRVAPLAVLLVLAACATTEHRAPVEERKPAIKPVVAAPAPAPVPAAVVVETAPTKPVPAGSENAGKPGYYSVKPGDTLIRIALDNGQNWRDVARWSGLDNPNIIEVGQVLRVAPPQADGTTAVATTRPVAAAGKVDSKPLDGRLDLRNDARNDPRTVTATTGNPATPTNPGAASAAGAAPTPSAAATPAAPAAVAATSAAPAAREADDDINWAWPAAGPVATGFDDAKSKGLAITGKPGDAVLAAADGRVVYAGSGLRGYGNLVIVKHNATYLTAYAHNQVLLVKEDQAVRRGQKIAEMGATDADRVQLHFEIRRLGKPIDPARLLPAR
jgi:lipoprotein NlpD